MESNKEVVLKVLEGAFVQRDVTVVDRYFSPDYVQHNPSIPNGPKAIAGLIPTLKGSFSYEVGMVVAAGDLVMAHGRYVGWGPKPLVAVDIFRLKDGKVVEHWDVMQEEIPASATASGNPMFTAASSKPADNRAFVLEAFDTLFNKRDYKAAERFWSPRYIQHSAHIAPGREGLFGLVKSQPAELRYENALAVADGDYVLLHGRFTGSAQPRAMIAADIVRMAEGVLVEHWDVLQDEVTKEESKSGLPMFGASFPAPSPPPAPATIAPPLTVEQARTIVAPLYDALNEPARKDVKALLAKAAHPDYRSFSTNDDSLTREQLAGVFEMLGSVVPDLRWTIEDIRTFGDQIVVRGEATGTPTGELFGAKPTGKSFKTMALDVFTVRDGKLASAYHVENWMTALQQISK